MRAKNQDTALLHPLFPLILTYKNMKDNYKESYDAPSCEVITVKTEGVICGSPIDGDPIYNGFGGEEIL